MTTGRIGDSASSQAATCSEHRIGPENGKSQEPTLRLKGEGRGQGFGRTTSASPGPAGVMVAACSKGISQATRETPRGGVRSVRSYWPEAWGLLNSSSNN